MFGLPAKATLWARMAAPALRAVQSNAGDLPLAPEREGGCLSGHGNVRGIWSNFCWINDYHPVCLCLSQCDHSLTSTEAPFPIIPFALVDTPRPAFWPTQLNHTAPHRTAPPPPFARPNIDTDTTSQPAPLTNEKEKRDARAPCGSWIASRTATPRPREIYTLARRLGHTSLHSRPPTSLRPEPSTARKATTTTTSRRDQHCNELLEDSLLCQRHQSPINTPTPTRK